MNAHQGKFLSSLVGLGVSVLVGMIGVTLGGFQFLTGSTFFTFFLTTAFGSSATSCTAFTAPDSNAAPLCATAGATFAKIQKKTSIKEGVSRFSYKSGDRIDELNPYTTDGLTHDYFQFRNMCGLTGTLLYKYMTGVSLPEEVSIITVEEELVYDNDRNKIIKLLNRTLANLVANEVEYLLKGNVPRGTTKLVTFI